ncbi:MULTISPECIES: DUF2637 domain-containing protein [Streptomyces]|uniref:DUF2637 domain-containing protein n=2 Tax=Streptomyces mutomycini TaxID=284036 RepID=A0ABW0BBR8_9ACTN|nr:MULTISPECIES: DUF2637 domain-containing protein [unclassified Streptomyces]KPC84207.1 membrane protein [Streptomyces sp. NRRL S-4]
MAAMQLTRTHRVLIGVVVAGAVLIAAIGFAGSYAAVRELAEEKGFGQFSIVFPIGIDAGICVLLALDLLLTWMRIPFPLLRQTAWLLTAATIAFNGAAAWPDPLGTGMHAVIPILFVVAVEAARHAVGRIADITADKHMEGVRLTRWLLSPIPTFKLWRRMKLWELRSYEQVIKLEQDRLIYQARLQARFGRNWRRKAPVESMMPLRLAKYGVPLAETAPAGLAAAGIEPALLPPAPAAAVETAQHPELPYVPEAPREQRHSPRQDRHSRLDEYDRYDEQERFVQQDEFDQQEYFREGPGSHESPWFAAPKVPDEAYEGAYDPAYDEGTEPSPVMIPSGPGRTRPLGNVGTIGTVPHPRREETPEGLSQAAPQPQAVEATEVLHPEDAPQLEEWSQEDAEFADMAFEVYSAYTDQEGQFPTAEILDIHLSDTRNVRHPRSRELLLRLMPEFKQAYVPAQSTADQSA